MRHGSDQPFNVATGVYGRPAGGTSGGCIAAVVIVGASGNDAAPALLTSAAPNNAAVSLVAVSGPQVSTARVIDAALGGLGGCPFAPGATGNVATEDVVWLFERMGVATGIDLAAAAAAEPPAPRRGLREPLTQHPAVAQKPAASADEEAPWGSRYCGSAATCG